MAEAQPDGCQGSEPGFGLLSVPTRERPAKTLTSGSACAFAVTVAVFSSESLTWAKAARARSSAGAETSGAARVVFKSELQEARRRVSLSQSAGRTDVHLRVNRFVATNPTSPPTGQHTRKRNTDMTVKPTSLLDKVSPRTTGGDTTKRKASMHSSVDKPPPDDGFCAGVGEAAGFTFPQKLHT